MSPDTSSTSYPKKQLPPWLKFVIILTVAGVGLSLLASLGLRIFSPTATTAVLEQIAEKSDVSLVESDKNHFVMQDKKTGRQVEVRTGATLPESFPSDIPLIESASITSSIATDSTFIIGMESGDSVEHIGKFYTKTLRDLGWNGVYTTRHEGVGISGLFKKDDRQIAIVISNADAEDKVRISLTHTNKKSAQASPGSVEP